MCDGTGKIETRHGHLDDSYACDDFCYTVLLERCLLYSFASEGGVNARSGAAKERNGSRGAGVSKAVATFGPRSTKLKESKLVYTAERSSSLLNTSSHYRIVALCLIPRVHD